MQIGCVKPRLKSSEELYSLEGLTLPFLLGLIEVLEAFLLHDEVDKLDFYGVVLNRDQ